MTDARRSLQPFAHWVQGQRVRDGHVVGGCVRDELLGALPTTHAPNLDVAVPRDALRLARDFARVIGGAFVPLDTTWGSARVVWTEGNTRVELDLSDFRAADLAGDLALRDFTINAMAASLERYARGEPLRSILVDPLHGDDDLRARRLRAVFDGTFREDGARLLRGVSLAARLDFTIEEHTRQLMRESANAIDGIAGERIAETLFQLLASPRAAWGLEQLDALTILERILPELIPCRGVSQGGYHHLDVWPHSLETVRQLELMMVDPPWSEWLHEPVVAYLRACVAGDRPRLALLKWAALCHDLGKPPQRRVDETGRVWFTGHERVGAEMAVAIAQRLKLSVRESEMLHRMIIAHLRPGDLTRMELLTRRAVYRFFRDVGEDGPSVLLVWLADRAATRGPSSEEARLGHQQAIIFELLEHYFLKPGDAVRLPRLLDGNEVMRLLRLPPGPEVGEVLRDVEEAQAEGAVRTAEEAIAFVRQWRKRT